MAAFDLQEQEQIAELKAMWAKWGMLITGTILAVVVGYLGRQLWTGYQAKQGEAAGNLYAAVDKAFEAHDAVKTRAAADAMVASAPSHAATA
ncbi:MAG: tetratricopeptide repeat protein, partial [Burkholderiales bacterium]|nr:tetratricopeptide repeat protein [Burkholderiales bacterium]